MDWWRYLVATPFFPNSRTTVRVHTRCHTELCVHVYCWQIVPERASTWYLFPLTNTKFVKCVVKRSRFRENEQPSFLSRVKTLMLHSSFTRLSCQVSNCLSVPSVVLLLVVSLTVMDCRIECLGCGNYSSAEQLSRSLLLRNFFPPCALWL